MEIRIERIPHGGLKVTITPADQKPITLTLNPGEVQSVVQLIGVAMQAQNFSFTYKV